MNVKVVFSGVVREGMGPQGQYWIEYLSITNNSNYQYDRC